MRKYVVMSTVLYRVNREAALCARGDKNAK